MKDILKKLNQKPIAYYPIYRQITGSTTGGILLSQLMYWFSKKDKIFKTDNEIMEETYLSKKELENAKKLIKNLDFITVSREGLPAITYYEINWENMYSSFHQRGKVDTPKKGNTTTQNGETLLPETGKHSIYTENTTENTTEIKENKEKILNPLVDELEKSEEINQSEKLILNGFVKYRKEIKKSIKTTGPLKLFLDELRKINAAGIDIKTAIKIMKDNEWQSIKLDWIQKLLNSDSSLALNVPAKKTFFEQTEEQKHEKQQSTLANIAKVRKLREEGLL